MSDELNSKQVYNLNKLQKRLRRHVGEAIADFNMIEDGDRIMVCLSGGKDSYGLLDILLNLRASAPIHFDIIAVNLDQKQPGFPADVLPAYLEQLGIPYKIVEEDTTPSSKTKFRKAKPPARFVPGCVAVFSTGRQLSWEQLKSLWVTIGMTFLKPCF